MSSSCCHLPIADRPSAPPRVSIGLPVYNAQRYLREAVDSILAQSYRDFELILSDNASTDDTGAICREYAARDARVRYHRNPRNLGAAPNFNMAFSLARGEYFKWAAYDDNLEPEYLGACVAALDAQPQAVLAHTATIVIDQQSQAISIGPKMSDAIRWNDRLLRREDLYDPQRDLTQANLGRRLTTFLLNTGWCFEIFGLMRADALRRTPLHLSFYGSDKVLLAALILQGTFIEVPRPLFLRRFHPDQSCNQDNAAKAAWMDARAAGGLPMPAQARTGIALLRLINDAPLSWRDRLGGYWAVARWIGWLVKLVWRLRGQRGVLYRLRGALRRALGRAALPETHAGTRILTWSDDDGRCDDSQPPRRQDSGGDRRAAESAVLPVLRDAAGAHVR